MNAEQRELFRRALLEVLEANNTRFGLGSAALRHLIRPYGFERPEEKEVREEVGYLEDKGLVAEVLKGVSPENRAWRITAAGRDYLAERG